MTPDKFIQACISGGYAHACIARRYVKGKIELTEADFAEAWRLEQTVEYQCDKQPNWVKDNDDEL